MRILRAVRVEPGDTLYIVDGDDVLSVQLSIRQLSDNFGKRLPVYKDYYIKDNDFFEEKNINFFLVDGKIDNRVCFYFDKRSAERLRDEMVNLRKYKKS